MSYAGLNRTIKEYICAYTGVRSEARAHAHQIVVPSHQLAHVHLARPTHPTPPSQIGKSAANSELEGCKENGWLCDDADVFKGG